ncbi:hypothetical protein LP420_36030 [Massilia sp. B-10]|nr:hypothetical protein LP420_36030 [Massilia sp. B-10]
MKLTVSAVLTHGQAVRELRLRAPDGAALLKHGRRARTSGLRSGSAGDRIERHYSLVGVAKRRRSTASPCCARRRAVARAICTRPSR